MVARTRESSPSRATRAQGRPLMIFAFGKNHSASFLLFPDPRGKFKVWYRWARYRWALVKPRFGKDEMCRRWGSTPYSNLWTGPQAQSKPWTPLQSNKMDFQRKEKHEAPDASADASATCFHVLLKLFHFKVLRLSFNFFNCLLW